jgi:hypothetical protein
MAGIVYALCALTALACSVLLLLSYKRTGNQLLLWSGLCFAGLTLNNLLVIVDLLLIESINFYTARNVTSLISLCLLLYGLIWRSE